MESESASQSDMDDIDDSMHDADAIDLEIDSGESLGGCWDWTEHN